MTTTSKRIALSVVVGLVVMAGLAALEQTAYTVWAERVGTALLIAAAVTLIATNVRTGQYRLKR